VKRGRREDDGGFEGDRHLVRRPSPPFVAGGGFDEGRLGGCEFWGRGAGVGEVSQDGPDRWGHLFWVWVTHMIALFCVLAQIKSRLEANYILMNVKWRCRYVIRGLFGSKESGATTY
jgi:hypothetical protein